MKQTVAILAPVAVAAAGAGLWILVSVFGRWEIGWLAIGIGAAVGAAAKWGNRWSQPPSQGWAAHRGLLASSLALLAMGGGKLGAAWLELDLEYRSYLSQVELAGSMAATEETAMFHLALDLVDQRESEEQQLAWPPGRDADSAITPADLPPEIWEATMKTWESMPDLEKKRHVEIAQAALNAFSSSEPKNWGIADLGDVIWTDLDIPDAIFTLLATVAAYIFASPSRETAPATENPAS